MDVRVSMLHSSFCGVVEALLQICPSISPAMQSPKETNLFLYSTYKPFLLLSLYHLIIQDIIFYS